MIRALTYLALMALPAAAAQAAVEVPSGQPVSALDVVLDAPGPKGMTARFRFVAPHIGAGDAQPDFALIERDMEFLCQEIALPKLAEQGAQVAQVIISLSDRAVPFGEVAPDATQFFEAYRPENGLCIWEGF